LGIVALDFEPQPLETVGVLGVVSSVWIFLALFLLYRTIKQIEYASLRSEKTIILAVVFKSKTQYIEISKGKVEQIDIGVFSPEFIEHFNMRVFVPPELEIKSSASAIITIQPKGFGFEGYNLVSYSVDCLGVGAYMAHNLEVLSNKTGPYVLPVKITGKGITPYSTQLNVIVKD